MEIGVYQYAQKISNAVRAFHMKSIREELMKKVNHVDDFDVKSSSFQALKWLFMLLIHCYIAFSFLLTLEIFVHLTNTVLISLVIFSF